MVSPPPQRSHPPALPLLQALPLLSGTVAVLLELVGEEHAVMAGVLDQGPQTLVLPGREETRNLLLATLLLSLQQHRKTHFLKLE